MSEIPFLNPAVLKQLDLPVPNRELTPQVLSPLNLNTLEEPSRELLAYRKLYG
ncbi:alpha/beta hydrolase, partial [Acinetobacter baumannii]|nr:alpha/beta hydrolase [Acinetobacter baumannii]